MLSLSIATSLRPYLLTVLSGAPGGRACAESPVPDSHPCACCIRYSRNQVAVGIAAEARGTTWLLISSFASPTDSILALGAL